MRITTLPLYLPSAWGAVAGATPGSVVPAELRIAADEAGTLVAAYARAADGKLARLPDSLAAARAALLGAGHHSVDAALAVPGSHDPVTVRAWLPKTRTSPGDSVDVLLDWEAAGGWPEGYTAFVHLRRDGENVAQDDGLPRYFVRYPVQDEAAPWLDWRQLSVPEDAADGTWEVLVGLYDAASGERAVLADGTSDEVMVGQLELRHRPIPDQACALIPAACDSMIR